jgi:hypothetical protein
VRGSSGSPAALQGGPASLTLGGSAIGRVDRVQSAQIASGEFGGAPAVPVLVPGLFLAHVPDQHVLRPDVDVCTTTGAPVEPLRDGDRQLDPAPIEIGPRQAPAAAGREGAVGHAAKITGVFRCKLDQPAEPLPAGSGRAPGGRFRAATRRKL